MTDIKQEWIDAGARALDSAGIRVNVYGMAQSESDAAAAVLEAVAPMIVEATDSAWYSTMLDGATSLHITVEQTVRRDIAREVLESPEGHGPFCPINSRVPVMAQGDTCNCPIKEIADRIAAGGEHVAT